MAVIRIDMSEEKVRERGEFPVVPAGKYVVEIGSFGSHTASTGNQGYLVKAQVLYAEEVEAGSGDPDEHIGVDVVDGFYGGMILPALVNALKSIGNTRDEAITMINDGFDTDIFVGEQVVWDITIATNPKTNKRINNVTQWSNVTDL